MDNPNCSTEHRKGQHLTAEELHDIEMHLNKGWSLDVCFGYALQSGKFSRNEMVCTKTLYNYVDLGLLPLKNIDLPEKLRRNTKAKQVRENRKNLGRSIDERPATVENRMEFGHWELDSVLGKKGADEPCALTLVERMTRDALWLKVKNHSAKAVTKAIQELKSIFGTHFSEVFKRLPKTTVRSFPSFLCRKRRKPRYISPIRFSRGKRAQTNVIPYASAVHP